jgi:hypothetical protein
VTTRAYVGAFARAQSRDGGHANACVVSGSGANLSLFVMILRDALGDSTRVRRHAAALDARCRASQLVQLARNREQEYRSYEWRFSHEHRAKQQHSTSIAELHSSC